MPFDEPGCVVDLPKDEQRLTEVLDGVEGAHPEQVLLQGPNEALRTAVPLRRPHKGGRTLDAQKGKLSLESVGHVLAPMIVPDGQTAPDLLGESPEAAPHALADGLKCLKAGGPARSMDAHALGRVMIDGDEHRDLTLAGDGRGQVGAPHRVHRRGDDGAVVRARAPGHPDPGGREQIVLAHEPQHPTLGRANARHAQPGPDLPVTLAVKGAGSQDGTDRLDQGCIRHRPNRARTPGQLGPGGGEMPIHAGPRGAPDPAHAGQTIGPAACGRDGPAHGRDLRRAKGRLASRAAILASSNSRSSSIAPSFAFRRSVSIASPSVDRVARLASPAATKVSCHPLRVAAVTPSARESVSRSSPRNRRSTASRLRLRDIRPPRPKPTPPEAVVSVVIVTLLRIMSALKGCLSEPGSAAGGRSDPDCFMGS